MTHATHTQGPWTVSQPSGSYIEAPTGGIAALTYGASKADALLIAAAPDLLAALELMESLFADHAQYDEEGFETAAILAAQSAIAKAKEPAT